ncbi:MAG: prepilin peptidase [Bdellovibrionales bacterium]|nr:prepilin peptidase [Bdellovibrionales bacterium]
MISAPWAEFLLTTLILAVGVGDDLRSRKIHNKLILFLLPVALIGTILLKGFSGILTSGLSALLACIMGVPLYLTKIVGGGDLKLLVVFAFTASWMDAGLSLLYALPWALLLGVFKIVLDKKFRDFIANLIFLTKFQKPELSTLHTIPFSLALLFGWLTCVSLKRGGLLEMLY